jgi:hypothetical protein
MFLAWRKGITVQISQLGGLSVTWYITHSVVTRTNTRWPVMWWFTKRWVMWRYLAYVSSPVLLQYLPKINGSCLLNSPHIIQKSPLFKFICHDLNSGLWMRTRNRCLNILLEQKHEEDWLILQLQSCHERSTVMKALHVPWSLSLSVYCVIYFKLPVVCSAHRWESPVQPSVKGMVHSETSIYCLFM